MPIIQWMFISVLCLPVSIQALESGFSAAIRQQCERFAAIESVQCEWVVHEEWSKSRDEASYRHTKKIKLLNQGDSWRYEQRLYRDDGDEPLSSEVWTWDGNNFMKMELIDRSMMVSSKEYRPRLGSGMIPVYGEFYPLLQMNALDTDSNSISSPHPAFQHLVLLSDFKEEEFVEAIVQGSKNGSSVMYTASRNDWHAYVETDFPSASFESYRKGEWEQSTYIVRSGNEELHNKNTITPEFRFHEKTGVYSLADFEKKSLMLDRPGIILIRQNISKIDLIFNEKVSPTMFTLDLALAQSIHDVDADEFLETD